MGDNEGSRGKVPVCVHTPYIWIRSFLKGHTSEWVTHHFLPTRRHVPPFVIFRLEIGMNFPNWPNFNSKSSDLLGVYNPTNMRGSLQNAHLGPFWSFTRAKKATYRPRAPPPLLSSIVTVPIVLHTTLYIVVVFGGESVRSEGGKRPRKPRLPLQLSFSPPRRRYKREGGGMWRSHETGERRRTAPLPIRESRSNRGRGTPSGPVTSR